MQETRWTCGWCWPQWCASCLSWSSLAAYAASGILLKDTWAEAISHFCCTVLPATERQVTVYLSVRRREPLSDARNPTLTPVRFSAQLACALRPTAALPPGGGGASHRWPSQNPSSSPLLLAVARHSASRSHSSHAATHALLHRQDAISLASPLAGASRTRQSTLQPQASCRDADMEAHM